MVPQAHRLRASLRLEGTSGSLLFNLHAQSRVSYSRLLKVMLSWVLNISKDGDSTAPLSNLLQCLNILTVKVCLNTLTVKVRLNGISCTCLFLIPLVLFLGTTKGLTLSSLLTHHVFIHTDKIPLSLVFSRLNSPSSVNLSSCVRLCGFCWTHLYGHLFYWEAQTWAQ